MCAFLAAPALRAPDADDRSMTAMHFPEGISHARGSVREAVPRQGHRQGPGRTPARSGLPQRAGHQSHLGHRPLDRGGTPGGLRRALPALDAGDAADRSTAVAVGGQGRHRFAIQGSPAPAGAGVRTHRRHGRRSRRRNDRSRVGRVLRVPRSHSTAVALRAQRCVDSQGVRRAACIERYAAAVPQRPGAVAGGLAHRHQPHAPVHLARAQGRTRRRAERRPRPDAHAQAGR